MLIKANYYSLSPRRFIAGTKNSYGVETISFEFSSEWEGLNKTVTFYPAGGAPVAVLYVDSPVYIPAEVMSCPGTAQFTVSGTKDSRSLISVTGYIDVLDTNDPGSKPAVEPTPSEMAQVLDMMNTALDAVNRVNTGANLDLAVLNSSFLHFSGDVYFESDTVSKKFFAKFFSLCIRGSVAQDIATDKTIEEIASACGLSLVTSTKGVTGCLCIPDEYVISYCTDDDSIKYAHRGDPILKNSSNIVIIAQNGGRLVDGLPFIQNMMLEALENKIGEGGTAEDSGNDDIIPSYWESAVNTAVSKLEAYQIAGGIDSFTFGFITDTHRKYYLDGNFASLMRRVLDSCDIPLFFHGGDLVDGAANVPKDELIADIKHHKEVFKSIEGKMLQAFGNHDSVYGINDLYDGGLNDAEIYNYIYRDNEGKNGIVRGATGRYFYKDNPVQKVRYIVLDSHAFETVIDSNGIATTGNKLNKAQYGAVQLSWLADALNVESGYSIVICSHMAPYRASDLTAIGWTGENCCADCDVALGIVNAYRNGTSYNYSGTVDGEAYSISVNYSARVGDIVCWVAGHSHKDHIFNLDGLKVVCSANCSLHQSTNPTGFAPAKTIGTDTEFAMDFFCVNKNSRTCNIVRLGATLEDDGVRKFSYSNETPSTITFTIDGTSYTATEGMTWAEWCNSLNNTIGCFPYEVSSNHGYYSEGDIAVAIPVDDYYHGAIYESRTDDDGTGARDIYQTINDVIVENGEYYIDDSCFAVEPKEDPTPTNTITFQVIGSGYAGNYTAEAGMTWAQWVNSSYNTLGFVVYNSETYQNYIATAATDEDGDGYLGAFFFIGDSAKFDIANDTVVENGMYGVSSKEIKVEAEEEPTPTPSTTTFTIDGTSYTAEVDEDGNVMTWQEWVNSEYNTDGFVIYTAKDGTKYISDTGTDSDGDGYINVLQYYTNNKYDIAYDPIISGGEYEFDNAYFEVETEPTPSTITFYIEGNDEGAESYTAEEGMTWAEWIDGITYVRVDDEYSPTDDGMYIMEDYTSSYIHSGEDEDGYPIHVKSSDTIIANHSYGLTDSKPTDSESTSTFTFTIGGIDNIPDKTYTAEEGMTWYEWVNSEYNTDGYNCGGANELVDRESYYVRDNDGDGDEMIGSNIIDPNETYALY